MNELWTLSGTTWLRSMALLLLSPPGMTNNEDWKILFEQVANESDPQKLSKLLDRLIRALDDRRQALRAMHPENPSAGSGEAET